MRFAISSPCYKNKTPRYQMKMYLLFSLAIFCSFPVHAQDTTRVALPDTVQNKSVQVTPYHVLNLNTSSVYVKKVDNPEWLRLSAGVHVFNALRGQVAGLSIPAYVANAGWAGLRQYSFTGVRNALLIVDGVPFNNSIGNYMNMNAFEYSSVATISNTNALSFLGGANSGVFVLTSKTGEGIERPTVEFNSYTTTGWMELADLSGNKTTFRRWHLSHSLAYSQDFGAVDARISYNNLVLSGDLPGNRPVYHFVKANVGAALTPRLETRLYLDGMFNRQELTGTVTGNERTGFYQGNLIINYKLNTWLKLVAQGVYALRDSAGKKFFTDSQTLRDVQDHQVSGNFFIVTQKLLENGLELSGFTGFQYHSLSRKLLLRTETGGLGSYEFTSEFEQRKPHLAAGFNFGYKNILYVHINGRQVRFSQTTTSSSGESFFNYSVSSTFNFGRIWQPPSMSNGKLRAAMGRHYAVVFSDWPLENSDYGSLPVREIVPHKIWNLEVGGDFGFFNSKLNLTFNYFNNRSEDTYLMPIQKITSKGWEVDMSSKVVDSNDLRLQAGILLSNVRFRSSLVESGFSDPSWRNNVTLQLTRKQFFIGIVVESLNFRSLVGSSFTKLRDLSLGYRLPGMWRNSSIKTIELTLSGRNLYKFSGYGNDAEEQMVPGSYTKSISANFYVKF
ncbi:MAG: hypothetical protein N2044_05605 [Cyclobacteriaceae bacterium]|nr:hypothetical protein [Cyclobacteriaceae bacterium]MCX7637308.1 hypothetical protein [Cyclobacteriaceae bacterium]MDW8331113.1 hypothetical protein [Cyclobacteriaceae bacterium]